LREIWHRAIAPFGIAKGRVLVIAPNLTIKEGCSNPGRYQSTEMFLAKRGVLTEEAMIGDLS